MPGTAFRVERAAEQAGAYDYFVRSNEAKPDGVDQGSRAFEYDTGLTYIFADRAWRLEHNSYGTVTKLLEDIKDELVKQTPAAEALLDKL